MLNLNLHNISYRVSYALINKRHLSYLKFFFFNAFSKEITIKFKSTSSESLGIRN